MTSKDRTSIFHGISQWQRLKAMEEKKWRKEEEVRGRG